MSNVLSGLGMACAVFTTGFLLAMGWFAGIKAGAWAFGPHRHENNYNIKMSGDGDNGGKP